MAEVQSAQDVPLASPAFGRVACCGVRHALCVCLPRMAKAEISPRRSGEGGTLDLSLGSWGRASCVLCLFRWRGTWMTMPGWCVALLFRYFALPPELPVPFVLSIHQHLHCSRLRPTVCAKVCQGVRCQSNSDLGCTRVVMGLVV